MDECRLAVPLITRRIPVFGLFSDVDWGARDARGDVGCPDVE
jgi:hypothetical protein